MGERDLQTFGMRGSAKWNFRAENGSERQQYRIYRLKKTRLNKIQLTKEERANRSE